MAEKTITLRLDSHESLCVQDALEREVTRRVNNTNSNSDWLAMRLLRLGSRIAWLRHQTFKPENGADTDRVDDPPQSQVALFGFSFSK